MKRSVTNFITLLFIGFLMIGVICVLQNIVQDVHRTFSTGSPHILAYQLK
jgi:hypothetical protein